MSISLRTSSSSSSSSSSRRSSSPSTRNNSQCGSLRSMTVLFCVASLFLVGLTIDQNMMVLSSQEDIVKSEELVTMSVWNISLKDSSSTDGNGNDELGTAAADDDDDDDDKNVTQIHHPYHDPINNNSSNVSYDTTKETSNREPLFKLLQQGNVTLDPERVNELPTWKEVTDKFGEQPIIVGLDTCAAFREAVPPKDRLLGGAGPFNSGTNILSQTLNKNCAVKPGSRPGGKLTGVHWQVNWGKHQSPRFRFENYVRPNITNANFFPIVMVRDPWTWFHSMCRSAYSAKWYHVPGKEGHCPNFIPNHVEREWFNKDKKFIEKYFGDDYRSILAVMSKANYTLDKKVIPLEVKYKSEIAHHDSLAHFWKDWYQEYYDATFPRAMIRLEDLVFRPYEVLKSVCECVGGKFVSQDDFSVVAQSAKTDAKGHGNVLQTNLVSSWFLHLRSNRTQGMTAEDEAFARNVLDDSVMSKFGYQHPDTSTRRH